MKKKILLMGKSGSGKTSMRSIIFASYLARDTMRLGPTLGMENSHVRFMGSLVLNLWDCGGQDAFMLNYFESQRESIFRNCSVLIYVFDIDSNETEKDLEYFQSCLDAIMQNSKDCKIFCLIHKFDLVPEENRESLFQERAKHLIEMGHPLKITCFRTSIWDETLFAAWSKIVYALVPNVQVLEKKLTKLASIIQSDEIVLFEKSTFLVISHATTTKHNDVHRFEKISNIIKQFKLSCSKTQAQFSSLMVRNTHFVAHIRQFTENTYILLVMDGTIPSAATLMNVEVARHAFEKIQ
eukprot:TRINITY_DN62172_c0_g1_i1.p1 TRINITY_DN62172_c0_g1~~TRINITY_DN62172_c0_g1_i1.p1  ORF type:complete len:306 (+),score=139.99 TRINITY_DN62172_c0_g1_i1:33-920(+)